MVVTHTTLALVGGAVVVVKQRAPLELQTGSPAGGEAVARARLHTEAEGRWLAAARHHGVVRLRLASAERCRLETRHAGLATLRTLDLRPPATAAVLAAAATVLADLHSRGLVHGNLTPDHIIVGRGIARPVLCSPSGTATDPAADVAGLAAVAAAVLPAAGRHDPAWLEAMERLRDDRHRIGARRAAALLAGLCRRRAGLPLGVARRLR
jgi:tRNA A-37 threonylcarbamoyl transferase component Bud32